MESGLYKTLTSKKMLIAHEEISDTSGFEITEGKILLPEQIDFISYPYEWCFDMWKDAALLTLRVCRIALEHGMVLKDATPFNIQFIYGKPIFIDTLSFEKYEEGRSWVAYRQFCECFLGFLLLMHYNDVAAHKMFQLYPSGIPVKKLSGLLPGRSKWNVAVSLHIHLQAKLVKQNKASIKKQENFSKKKLQILLTGLQSMISKLRSRKEGTEWAGYYSGSILNDRYYAAKAETIAYFLRNQHFSKIVDLGANNGGLSHFSGNGDLIIAVDNDSNAINHFYLENKKNGHKNFHLLVADLVNPSPAIGWNNEERASLNDRLKGDLISALALVHHLVISNNLNFSKLIDWLKPMGPNLLIEFVPKEDEKVQILLANREDIFPHYDLYSFKQAFGQHYEILEEQQIDGSQRTLFLMKRK